MTHLVKSMLFGYCREMRDELCYHCYNAKELSYVDEQGNWYMRLCTCVSRSDSFTPTSYSQYERAIAAAIEAVEKELAKTKEKNP